MTSSPGGLPGSFKRAFNLTGTLETGSKSGIPNPIETGRRSSSSRHRYLFKRPESNAHSGRRQQRWSKDANAARLGSSQGTKASKKYLAISFAF